jgi:hypothetical protein
MIKSCPKRKVMELSQLIKVHIKAHFTLGVKGQKNLGPTLSIFGLLFGPKLLINARTLVPRVANWPPKFDGLFSSLGAKFKVIKFSIY